MHPAYSVIVFTTASGAGYGLLFWLATAHAAGLLGLEGWLFFIAMAIALALITAGLLASTAHLGHPERAWRAFSQWRSSWLSREGVAAVATYAPAGILALLALAGQSGTASKIMAVLAALGAVATVYCTGMIYASLRTIRQWNLSLVPANYLILSAASGGLLAALALAWSGRSTTLFSAIAVLVFLLAAACKLAYWRRIDGDRGQYTAEMAVGLGNIAIRQLEPPHTRPNYVMREMGYSVARRHAARLRGIALSLLYVGPVLLLVPAMAYPPAAGLLLVPATLSAAIGLLVERWLFFAEATHVSMLYYGAERA